MNLRHVFVVLGKELTDAVRDRRSLLSAFVYPLTGPVLVVGLFHVIIDAQDIDEPVHLPVAGAEYAPGLLDHLRRHDIEVEPAPADPEAAVRTGSAVAVLTVPPDFGERFREGRSIEVELLVESSRKEGRSSVSRVEHAIARYSGQVGVLRLLARGVDPQLVRPIALVSVDLATPRQRAAEVIGVIPMFVIMAAFIGGMYVATDSTAGERERGSLEPLLTNPVDRRALAGGKWIATAVMSAASLVLTVVTSSIALNYANLEELGISVQIGITDALAIAGVMLPLALLAAGVQLLVASFARSFREAQTYLSLLMFVPMLPGMYMMAASLDPAPWMGFVPVLAQQVIMTSVLRGEGLDVSMTLLSLIVSLVFGLVGVGCTARLFKRERIIFGA